MDVISKTNGHYQARHAATSMADVTGACYLPDVRPAQQTKLITLTKACQLAKDQIAVFTLIVIIPLVSLMTLECHGRKEKLLNFRRAVYKEWKTGCNIIRCHIATKTVIKSPAIIKIPGHSISS